jgi:hypothetical protein
LDQATDATNVGLVPDAALMVTARSRERAPPASIAGETPVTVSVREATTVRVFRFGMAYASAVV